jgi:hypothetical protein
VPSRGYVDSTSTAAKSLAGTLRPGKEALSPPQLGEPGPPALTVRAPRAVVLRQRSSRALDVGGVPRQLVRELPAVAGWCEVRVLLREDGGDERFVRAWSSRSVTSTRPWGVPIGLVKRQDRYAASCVSVGD